MGSPLSATAANVVMEELEKHFFLNCLMISYFITDMYLNIQIINNKIKNNWHRKPIWSCYINFFSNHSLSDKIRIIYSITDRAILLSDKKFHVNHFNCERSTLLMNEYPSELSNEKLYERYKKLISNQQETNLLCEIYDRDNCEKS